MQPQRCCSAANINAIIFSWAVASVLLTFLSCSPSALSYALYCFEPNKMHLCLVRYVRWLSSRRGFA